MKKKVMVTFQDDILDMLDKYAQKRTMGNRSMAIHMIILDYLTVMDIANVQPTNR